MMERYSFQRVTPPAAGDMTEMCRYLDYIAGGPEVVSALLEILKETKQDKFRIFNDTLVRYTPRFSAILVWGLLMRINMDSAVREYRRMTAS